NGVVVTWNLVVDLVRIAVRVKNRDHRNAQLARLADGDVLLLGVDDPDGAWHLAHLADAAQRALQLVLLPLEHQLLLLGGRAFPAALLLRLELLEPLQPLVHGREVGQHAAQPALVDVGHADAGGLLGDRLLRLLLGTDEQHRSAVGDGLLDELVRAVDVGERLLQVDDVDAVALGEDVALHLRVPAPGLVPEVNAGVEHLLHGDDGHAGRPPCCACAPRRAPRLPRTGRVTRRPGARCRGPGAAGRSDRSDRGGPPTHVAGGHAKSTPLGVATPKSSRYPYATPNSSASASVQQAVAAGDRRRLGAPAHAELGEDVRHVDAHGLLADVELAGDLPVGAA